MLLEEDEKPGFKQWLLPKLEVISDASPEVLADYAIALVTSGGSVEVVKRNAVEALSEFLHDYAGPFVDEAVAGIQRKSWAVKAELGKKSSVRTGSRTTGTKAIASPLVGRRGQARKAGVKLEDQPTSTPQDPPTGPAALRTQPTTLKPYDHKYNNQGEKPRKRKLDAEIPNNHVQARQSPIANQHARPAKRQSVQQVGNLPRDHIHTGGNGRTAQFHNPNRFPTATTGFAPTLSTSFASPQIDFSNPAAFATHMVNMLNMRLSAMNTTTAGPGGVPHSSINSMRCRSLDLQGFCILGIACPFDHTGMPATGGVPGYDPNNPSLAVQAKAATSNTHSASSRYGEPKIFQGGRHAIAGRPLNTKLVVEHIPENCFTVNHVRQFFAQFGNIIDVQLQNPNRLATIEFENHDMAQRAYDSPRVIFNNRFVRLYWHKTRQADDNGSTAARYGEAFERQQDKAQKAFQERQKRLKEKDAKTEEIERKLQAKEEEIKRLRRNIAEKTSDKHEKERLMSESAILTDLSLLQAEAEGLFAARRDSNASSAGAGGFVRRFDRGRGRGGKLRCAVKRVDNRPRRLAIAGIEPGSERDYAIKSYLANTEGCEDVDAHLEQGNTLVASFSERYLAEKFLDESAFIPGVGRLRLRWVMNGESVVAAGPNEPATAEQDTAAMQTEADGEDFSAKKEGNEMTIKVEDDDLDVAEDADQWA
ncbi:unnamed protein product [Periconia digitata]|uniref:RRM domain-containing protein n=1 Tax=Periconia digitata TaxID=1303443 RepID=A0A9W4U1F5_9PLEO|nr:unnamed protein product [Periconia digitata]